MATSETNVTQDRFDIVALCTSSQLQLIRRELRTHSGWSLVAASRRDRRMCCPDHLARGASTYVMLQCAGASLNDPWAQQSKATRASWALGSCWICQTAVAPLVLLFLDVHATAYRESYVPISWPLSPSSTTRARPEVWETRVYDESLTKSVRVYSSLRQQRQVCGLCLVV